MIRTSLERRSTGSTRVSRLDLRMTPRTRLVPASSFLTRRASQPSSSALELDQQPVAHAGRGAGFAGLVGDQDGARGVGGGLDQPDVEFAVDILLDHVDDADGGQGAGLGEALLAALAQLALGLQLAEHLAQGAAFGALQPEGAGQIGFVGFPRLAQVAQQGFLVGKAAGRGTGRAAGRFDHESRLARFARPHHGRARSGRRLPACPSG
jgi:hypothetical protein